MNKKYIPEEVRERLEFYKTVEEETIIPQKDITKEDKYNAYKSYTESTISKEIISDKYSKFTNEVRRALVKESLEYLLSLTVKDKIFVNENTAEYGKRLVNNYVNETGPSNIIKKMKSANSLFLANIVSNINESYKNILELTDSTNPNSFVIRESDIKTFYDHLDISSFKDTANVIRARVASSVEEFINANKQDKEKIENLLTDTKDNVITTVTDELQKEAAELHEKVKYKTKINNVLNRRKRGIFEEMVYRNSNGILKDDALLESFTVDGKVDMEYIVEYSELSYTFLELLNTTRIENITESELEKVLNNI